MDTGIWSLNFDQPVTLENGDILTFHMGLPE